MITENIAHANTPGYKRKVYQFQDQLQKAMRKGTAEAYQNIGGRLVSPRNTLVRHNGNNVDIEKEVLDLGENRKLHRLYSEMYNRKSELLSIAIRGGR